jgi:hypothetical protein
VFAMGPDKCSIGIYAYDHRIKPIYRDVYVVLYVMTRLSSCLAHQKDSSFASKVKKIVVLGGAFFAAD